MKNIIIFIDSLTGGGAERTVIALSRYLTKYDYKVCIVTMHGEGRDFYPLPGKVKRFGLNLVKKNKGICKLFYNIRRAVSLRKIIKEENADAVIGFMTTCSVLSIVSSVRLKCSCVTAERNYPGRKPAIKPWGFLRSVFYRFADAHIVQSKETASWLKQHAGARNTYIIPNAVSWPLKRFPPSVAPSTLVGVDSKLILAVGTKPYQKGFDILLEAFTAMNNTATGWVLAIVGLDVEGSEDDEINALGSLVDRLGIADSVIFPGRIGNVADWYERANMFVLSSRYEGFPNVLLEAMAAGCPSIAFDCDTGPRDIIRHGENGLLVEPENTEKLAEAMLALMHDDALRQRISASSIGVREEFAEEKIFSEWEKVINEV
ncbi:glycosyltransferase family 4 protein [Billgrantia sp. Q4P2]|uniref:glycosyltransferase family 4 protein n=1 Tax=Billgrantia sp. Q4P2 TaxID=3463857 RepID=UPI0040571DA6